MIPFNIRFWYLIHDSAEKVWHWVWRTKLGPYHQKLWNAKKPDPVIYTTSTTGENPVSEITRKVSK